MTAGEWQLALAGVALGAGGLRFIQWMLWTSRGPVRSRVGYRAMSELRRRLARDVPGATCVTVRRDLLAALVGDLDSANRR